MLYPLAVSVLMVRFSMNTASPYLSRIQNTKSKLQRLAGRRDGSIATELQPIPHEPMEFVYRFWWRMRRILRRLLRESLIEVRGRGLFKSASAH